MSAGPPRRPPGPDPCSSRSKLRHARHPVNQEEKVSAFWAWYAEKILESGAKPPLDRWLTIPAEAYISAHPERQLADQSAAEVVAYLAALGRKPEVTGWQVRQAADAIRIRLELAGMAGMAGGNTVDVAHWQASARDYEAVGTAGASAVRPLAAIIGSREAGSDPGLRSIRVAGYIIIAGPEPGGPTSLLILV